MVCGLVRAARRCEWAVIRGATRARVPRLALFVHAVLLLIKGHAPSKCVAGAVCRGRAAGVEGGGAAWTRARRVAPQQRATLPHC